MGETDLKSKAGLCGVVKWRPREAGLTFKAGLHAVGDEKLACRERLACMTWTNGSPSMQSHTRTHKHTHTETRDGEQRTGIRDKGNRRRAKRQGTQLTRMKCRHDVMGEVAGWWRLT